MQNNRVTLDVDATPSMEEISIVNFLIQKGLTERVHFLKASKIEGVRTPDIMMNGLKWEMKTPIGRSSNTIKRAFKTAMGQSDNIIFDLRRSGLPDQANIPRLEKEFRDIKRAKRLIIITKTKKVLTYFK